MLVISAPEGSQKYRLSYSSIESMPELRNIISTVNHMAREIIDILLELRDRGELHAVATVVEAIGSVSAKTGAKAIIGPEGRIMAGWVGGGCAESAVGSAALECMDTGKTKIMDIDLDDEVLGVGMPCGGSMRVFIEPIQPKPTLWIMGHGRIAECLCHFADTVGFNVAVNDPIATAERFPDAHRLISDDPDYSSLEPGPQDFVVIATQHKGDHESMQRALAARPGYIALIASHKRASLVMDYLKEAGFPQERLDRVNIRAGLDIGARTPEEIALSVISEIVMLRRGGSGRRMSDILMSSQATLPAASGSSK